VHSIKLNQSYVLETPPTVRDSNINQFDLIVTGMVDAPRNQNNIVDQLENIFNSDSSDDELILAGFQSRVPNRGHGNSLCNVNAGRGSNNHQNTVPVVAPANNDNANPLAEKGQSPDYSSSSALGES
jgi:hypothetical protein